MSDNKVTLDQLDNSAVEAMSSSVGDVSMLNTENKTIVGAISEIVGKKEIANAIGEPLAETDKFTEMSSEINGLLSTFKTNMMNAGVVVESGDKFKALIDKIKGLTEGEGNKGIQYAEGVNTISHEYLAIGRLHDAISNLDFKPTVVFVHVYKINTGADGSIKCSVAPFTIDSLHHYDNDTLFEHQFSRPQVQQATDLQIYVNTVDNGFQIFFDTLYSGYTHFTFNWYAIGVGEEDTTLRDSLADILENKGVDVTEEDDMTSLITKVDSIKVNNIPDWLITNVWYQKVASKTLNDYSITGSVKDIIYSIGGGEDSLSSSKIFNCFLPASNTWSTRAALPSDVSDAQTAVYDDNYIYCFGGCGNSGNLKTNYCYDYSLDIWTTKANMASSEYDGAGAILDTTIYCIGGTLSGNANRTYDILTNTWSTKTNLPATRRQCEAVGFNGFVYLYGGTNGNYSQSTMYAYDPSIDTWTAKADGGTDRLDHVMVVIKDRIYCSGGQDGGTSLKYYNPVTDSWTTKASLPVSMGGVGTRGAAYNGILYHFSSSTRLTYIPD